MHIRFGGLGLLLLGGLFAATPTSTNYTLKTFDIGGGGGSGSSTNYKLNAITGTQTSDSATSTNYAVDPGAAPPINSNVPTAPTISNPSSYYDRLKLVLTTNSDPTDTKYAIAISTDNFATVTRYVKSDNSTGSTLAITDYQTYASWGGASGFLILGLQQNTTYTVKVKAFQGNFSESAYGPTASAATVAPSLTFGVATTLTGTPPFTMNFTSLASGSVFSGNADASISLTTNALSGGAVYIKDLNNGLLSSGASYTVSSATADLSLAASGYGAIVTAASQSSGGPLTAASPYNGASNNVGIISTSLRQVATSSTSVTGGTLTVRVKAKTDSTTPASTDYADTLTFIAAMLY